MNHMRDVESPSPRGEDLGGPTAPTGGLDVSAEAGCLVPAQAGRCRMRLQPLAGESSELITTPPANPPWPGALSGSRLSGSWGCRVESCPAVTFSERSRLTFALRGRRAGGGGADGDD